MPEIPVNLPLEWLIPPAPPAERPAPMTYTGEPCRCGTDHVAGTDAERAHARATHAWDMDQMYRRIADEMAASVERTIVERTINELMAKPSSEES